MILTEEEAKQRWCPMVRLFCSYGSYNREDAARGIPTGTRCIASDCMMWRWVEDGLRSPTRVSPKVVDHWVKNLQHTRGETGEDGYVTMIPPKPTKGFCGLTGG